MYKSLKYTKLKITPTCFGSYVIHHQGIQSCAWLKLLVVVDRYFVVCLVGVLQRNFELVVCVYDPADRPYRTHTHTSRVQNYAAKHRPSTRQNICEPLRVISVSSVLTDDGAHKSETCRSDFLILCLLNFYTTQILNS